MRQNYLLLPEDVMSHSAETKEMSIGMWVNAKDAGISSTYMWSPLFSAHGQAPGIAGTANHRQLAYVCIVCKRNITTE